MIPPSIFLANQGKALAAALLEDIRLLSEDLPGVTREAYGASETATLEYLSATAAKHGMRASLDRAANLVLSLPGDDLALPGLLIGSHLDSVPHGGNYDGLAGVAAGFLCLAGLVRDGVTPPCPVRVIGLRCEESAWFGKPYIGSSLALGLLDPAFLSTPHRSGRGTLYERLKGVGADAEAAARGEALMDTRSVAAYMELHIEQGPAMTAQGTPVAAVPGIRGNVRFPEARITGQAGHSGAVPRELRRDAVFAFAEFVTVLDRLWADMLMEGRDLAVTCGVAHTDPAHEAMTRIPDEVRTCLDVRSLRQGDLDEFLERLAPRLGGIEARRGVSIDLGKRLSSAPAVCSPRLLDRLKACQRELGLATAEIPSGAGHDAAMFAKAGVESAMIFVRNANGSHNPAEAMDLDDFMAGVELLDRFARSYSPAAAS
jgi:N-carbamoyl-L-amino-acid hydrolase